MRSFMEPDVKLEKHPLFDEYWQQYHKLIYWWAAKLSKISKQGGGYLYRRPSHFWSMLIVRLNECLKSYDPAKSAFTSFFGYNIYGWVDDYEKYDSQHQYNYWWNRGSKHVKKIGEVTYNLHEVDFYLYRIPDLDEDWTDEILDLFDTAQDCWNFLTKGLGNRDRLILEKRFKDGTTLTQIGQDLGVCKQRIEQIIDRVKRQIKNQLKKIEKFAELFTSKKEEN